MDLKTGDGPRRFPVFTSKFIPAPTPADFPCKALAPDITDQIAYRAYRCIHQANWRSARKRSWNHPAAREITIRRQKDQPAHDTTDDPDRHADHRQPQIDDLNPEGRERHARRPCDVRKRDSQNRPQCDEIDPSPHAGQPGEHHPDHVHRQDPQRREPQCRKNGAELESQKATNAIDEWHFRPEKCRGFATKRATEIQQGKAR